MLSDACQTSVMYSDKENGRVLDGSNVHVRVTNADTNNNSYDVNVVADKDDKDTDADIISKTESKRQWLEAEVSTQRHVRNQDSLLNVSIQPNHRSSTLGNSRISNLLDINKFHYKNGQKWMHTRGSIQESIRSNRASTNVRLEEHIKLQHLQQIMQEFVQHTPTDVLAPQLSDYFMDKSQKRTPGCMNLNEFKDTIMKVIGTDEYNDYLEKLFMKLDTTCDGFVDWNEFCTHLLLLYRENDYLCVKSEKPFVEEPKIRHITHNRQEQTSKILAVQGPLRYLTVSKEGAICVWYPSLTVDKHYVIADQADDQKRRFKMWVTDAVYMKNCQKVAIGSTSRDIRFYDVSSSQYFEEYHLFAMADVPYCFDYHYNTKQPNTESLLIFGVDTGAIHLLTFMKPVTQLFENPFKNDGGVQKIFMQDISSHNKWVHHYVITDVHQDIIRQVCYLPENEAIISGSASSKSTVVICDLLGVKKSYIFKIEKGVNLVLLARDASTYHLRLRYPVFYMYDALMSLAFSHSGCGMFRSQQNLNLLVTGSGDHLVRLWNSYVTNSPIATLHGHATGVIGVVIHEHGRQVFSYSKEAVIKVWDIKEHTCIQTVILKFPSSLHGRMPEHGQFPINLQGPPRNAFIVTCNDYMAVLRMGKREETKSYIEVTHDTQLCSAIYNKLLKQVATGCDSSTITLWDIETGQRSTVLPNAHRHEEITYLAFDASYRRLISGARNGTVKVWNSHNGHKLHKLEPVGEAEVTGIVHLPDKKVILTVGWNQRIVSYDDSDSENKFLPAQNSWKRDQFHKDDILSADYVPPNFLATASYDGEITIWDVEMERVYLRLRKGQPPNISTKLEELKTHVAGADVRPRSRSGCNSRPNSRHRSSHKIDQGQTAPVDKLLFLKNRAGKRFTDSAVLVSSEAGTLRFWNIFTSNKEMGYFYAPKVPDESVLALCTSPDDRVLLAGDTMGMMYCWNIQKYCLTFEGYVNTTPPPMQSSWRAHDSAIVSVEYIEHVSGNFVLTASTDKSARLWTPEGHFIGTFGQRAPWNLKITSTWVHPRTPWSRDEENRAEADLEDTAVAGESSEVVDNVIPEEKVQVEEITELNYSTNPVLENREKSYISKLTFQNTPTSTTSSIKSPSSPSPLSPASSMTDYISPGDSSKFCSETHTCGFDLWHRPKTFLGSKAEEDLIRRQRDRKGRRAQFGDISQHRTAGFDKQCSPYHALKAPDWQDVELPSNLPLSQRMRSLGYSGNNLTEEYIKAMDFSYSQTGLLPPKRISTSGLTNSSSRPDRLEKLPPIKSNLLRHVTKQPGNLSKSSTIVNMI